MQLKSELGNKRRGAKNAEGRVSNVTSRGGTSSAEQAAWDAATPAPQLRSRARHAVQHTPTERLAFAGIVCLAAAGIVWGLVNMFQLVERWPAIVANLRALLG